jgi:hypothetical protein
MITTVYPNYPWKVAQFKNIPESQNIEESWIVYFIELQFTSLDDWLNVKKSQITKESLD